eukprot:gene8030-744_t
MTSISSPIGAWKDVLHLSAAVIVLIACATPLFAKEEERYCPYFGNRGTDAMTRPGLGDRNMNCSWYHKEACCRTPEIYGIFQAQPTIPGADFGCQIAMTRLMCWAEFYYGEQLHVCRSMCDYVYQACSNAVMSDQLFSIKYSSGGDLCREWRLEVREDEDGMCYDGAFHLTSPGGRFLAKQEKPPKAENSASSVNASLWVLILTVIPALSSL